MCPAENVLKILFAGIKTRSSFVFKKITAALLSIRIHEITALLQYDLLSKKGTRGEATATYSGLMKGNCHWSMLHIKQQT